MNKATQKEILNIVKANYTEIAKHYAQTRRKELWPALSEILHKIPEKARVLDVGCGSGRLLKALSGKKVAYLGIDPCTELLAEARKDYPERAFTEGDAANLGTINELNFDYVFCIAVLQHLPGQDLRVSALRQMKNKLAPDGRLVISVWNIYKQPKFKKLIRKFFFLKLIGKNRMDYGDIFFDWKNPAGDKISRRYYHAFRQSELKKLFKLAGLEIEEFFKDEYNFYAVLRKRGD